MAKFRRSLVQISGGELLRSADTFGQRLDVIDKSDRRPHTIEIKKRIQLASIAFLGVLEVDVAIKFL
jgi:hypothetical protein